MALWGKSTTAESRPKWLGGDGAQGASGAKEDAFANTAGWALRAGTAASGNDNTSAQVEVIACVSGLGVLLGAANVLSVDFTAGTYAHAGATDFDMVYTFDEAITVTSATATANNVVSNKINIVMHCLGPADLVNDATMKMQYYSGSGTNKLTFRGRIPADAEASGYIALSDGTAAMATDGSSAAVDASGTTVTAVDGDHHGGSAVGGPNASTSIWGVAVKKTGSTANTLVATTGSASGSSSLVLTGVRFAS